MSARTSPTCDGGTPNFSLTSAGPMRRFFMVSRTVTLSSQSCIKSLSDEQITTSMPPATASLRHGGDHVVGLEPRHRQGLDAEGIDDPAHERHLARQLGRHRRAVRLVLGVDLVPEVRPGASNTTQMWVGACSRTIRSSIWHRP